MMTPAIELHQVHQSFRTGFWMKPTPILNGMSFSVPSHSIFGFLGANGAGKTTLIHLIAGLGRPRSGSLRVFGYEAHTREARARIGYLPERPYFHEHLTGQQLLQYFGSLSGLSSKHLTDRIPRVLSTVELKEARHQELRTYSKGMLQRLGIAQAILHDPELLILDEPMSGLDPVGRKEIRELIVHLASEGRTIFFSSHVIPDVEAICDQIAILQKGRVLHCGPLSSFLKISDKAEFEIRFTGLSQNLYSQIIGLQSYRQLGDITEALIQGQDSVQKVASQILELKGTLLSIQPIRPSLESLFL